MQQPSHLCRRGVIDELGRECDPQATPPVIGEDVDIGQVAERDAV